MARRRSYAKACTTGSLLFRLYPIWLSHGAAWCLAPPLMPALRLCGHTATPVWQGAGHRLADRPTKLHCAAPVMLWLAMLGPMLVFAAVAELTVSWCRLVLWPPVQSITVALPAPSSNPWARRTKVAC